MPATSFPEYAQGITDAVENLVSAGQAVLVSLQLDQRSVVRGFIAGSVQFQDGSVLNFREFVDVTQAEPKIMYAYHYQDENHNLIFRYDNAVHRPALPKREHRHNGSDVAIASVPTLSRVLDEISKEQN